MALYERNFNEPDTTLGDAWDAGYTLYDNFLIVSNSVRSTAVENQASMETLNSPSIGANQWIEVVVNNFTPPASFGGIFLILRAAAPATMTYYFAGIIKNGGSVYTEIWKSVAGTETQLVSVTTYTLASGDKLMFAAIADNLLLYKNATLLISARDSAIASGRPGVRTNLAIVGDGGALTDVQFDDLRCGDWPPPELNTPTLRVSRVSFSQMLGSDEDDGRFDDLDVRNWFRRMLPA